MSDPSPLLRPVCHLFQQKVTFTISLTAVQADLSFLGPVAPFISLSISYPILFCLGDAIIN